MTRSHVPQIHDELVIEVRKEHLQAGASLLKSCMEHAWALQVPLEVQLQSGHSWGHLQPYEPT